MEIEIPDFAVLVALSGGADSMALLDMLLCGGANATAAHFNHKLRGDEAERDEAFVRDYCEKRGVPAVFGRADVKALAKENAQTIEQAARTARYGFLRARAKELGCKRIALAHHMDDQAETLLLNLSRGTGLTGLCAMRGLSGDLWRPLLGFRKAELLSYCQARGIPYVTDSTNACTEYNRNYIRKLLRDMERVNPAFVANCAKTAGLCLADEEYINIAALSAFEAAFFANSLDCSAIVCQPSAIAARMLRELARRAGLFADFELSHTRAVLKLCSQPSGSGVDLAHGFIARVSYGRLIIERRIDREEYCAPLQIGKNVTPFGIIYAEYIEPPFAMGAGFPAVIEADAAALEGAVVRNRQNGDFITLFGSGHKKKLKDVLSDKKVDKNARLAPVVARGGEVLWSPVAALSEKLRARENSKAMRLRFAPLPSKQ